MLVFFCKTLGWMSLPWIHRFGSALGYISYWFDQKSNRIALNNILQSGLTKDAVEAHQLMRSSRIEAGKSLLETLYIWGSDQTKLLPLIREVHGWQHVIAAQQSGKGLIFLTPHLGCYEMASIFYGAQHAITVLYRPPKLSWLQGIVTEGRAKGNVSLAPANAQGVKKLLLALKAGQAIGILPDQIPKQGEGEWAPLFGKPAYTMGLASKLATKSGASIIMAFAERRARGEGYHIHLKRIPSIATPTLLNAAVATQIAQCPSQYLWQYNRFKQRRYAMHKLQANISPEQNEHNESP